MRTNLDRLRSIRKVGPKESKSRGRDTKVKRETREKDGMVNSIKGRRQVKEEESRDPLAVHSK